MVSDDGVTPVDMVQDALRHVFDTQVVEVGSGVLAGSGRIVRDTLCRNAERILLVADGNTWEAAGALVRQSLEQAGVELVEPMLFPTDPPLYASYENCQTIRQRLACDDALAVAVGSGTINDLVKLASGELERPYAVVGTAASMDGYTGFGAPMTRDGVKVTMACPAPRVVIFDLDVAAAAPAHMTASGFGDLCAKIPAGADWMLSDAVGWEPLDDLAWRLVQGGVSQAMATPKELAAGEPAACAALVNGLILSGLAMQVYGQTRPASGAEHYFSHLWELEHVGAQQDPPVSHGDKVAVGTLVMAAFYERLLARDLAALDVEAAVSRWPSWQELEADIRRSVPGAVADHCVEQTQQKYLDHESLGRRLTGLAEQWDVLGPRIREQLRPARQIQQMLRDAGAPTVPQDIGITVDHVRRTFPAAAYYRARYSALDLAREAGWLAELTDEVFAPGGLWT